MNEKYFKKSKITGRTYDLFSVVRILNIEQVIFYLSRDIPLQEIEISTTRKENKPILVFYFNRSDSKEAYDEWCERMRDRRID